MTYIICTLRDNTPRQYDVKRCKASTMRESSSCLARFLGCSGISIQWQMLIVKTFSEARLAMRAGRVESGGIHQHQRNADHEIRHQS